MDPFGPEAIAHYLEQLDAQPKQTAGWGPYAAIAGSNAADLATSLYDMSRRGTVEGNPLNGSDKTSLVLSKLLPVIVDMSLVKWLSDSGHPTAAKWTGYLSSVPPAVAALHNMTLKK